MTDQYKQDAMRYQFLRDKFAIDADDDKAEFAKLAQMTGKEFDAVIDEAMTQDPKVNWCTREWESNYER